jgi:hypothetical protein
MSGCRVKIHGLHPTRHTVESRRVRGFLFIIFGLGQVLFLGLGDNFDPHPTRCTVESVFSGG